MQLVKSRPIALPIFNSGCWYDDFAVTGANSPSYSVISGAKDKTANGILLRATALVKNGGLYLPTWYNAKHFQAEFKSKRIVGTTILYFRQLSTNDKMFIAIDPNTVMLRKAVTGTYTTIATKSNINTDIFRIYEVRSNGYVTEVYVDGVKIISVTDTDNLNHSASFAIEAWASSNGIAQSEWQYLAIKPL